LAKLVGKSGFILLKIVQDRLQRVMIIYFHLAFDIT
jgi:hypothetical protein